MKKRFYTFFQAIFAILLLASLYIAAASGKMQLLQLSILFMSAIVLIQRIKSPAIQKTEVMPKEYDFFIELTIGSGVFLVVGTIILTMYLASNISLNLDTMFTAILSFTAMATILIVYRILFALVVIFVTTAINTFK